MIHRGQAKYCSNRLLFEDNVSVFALSVLLTSKPDKWLRVVAKVHCYLLRNHIIVVKLTYEELTSLS